MAATLPGQTAGVSLFIDAFIEDLGVSRTTVSWLYTVATGLGSLTLPLVGRLVDRYGPRRVALVVIALLAATCMGMSRVSGWIGVFVGFVGLRGLGQGALGLVNNHAVNLWFERRRGFAIGGLGLGMAGAVSAFPPLIEQGLQACCRGRVVRAAHRTHSAPEPGACAVRRDASGTCSASGTSGGSRSQCAAPCITVENTGPATTPP